MFPPMVRHAGDRRTIKRAISVYNDVRVKTLVKHSTEEIDVPIMCVIGLKRDEMLCSRASKGIT